MAHIAVVGAGYVGLTTAAGLASLGHRVVCADIAQTRIEALNRGEIPIVEQDMEELVRAGLDSGLLRFVVGAATACAESEFHFFCLPTPPGADGSADLSFILDVTNEVRELLPSGSIIVNKSTVPVGTAQIVSNLVARDDIFVVSNPEFLREGTAVADFLNPDRIVLGGDDMEATQRVAALYADLDTIVLLSDTKSSELIKYASNAYLATKLTFVNEIAEICEELGADVDKVMTGMGHDHRIGTSYLNPGPGWGGSCFPKDTEALVHIAASVKLEFDFLRNVIALNHRHIARIAKKVAACFDGDVAGKRIASWGLTFKAGTDDLRDSPALAVLRLLVAEGAVVTAYDPAISRPTDLLAEMEVVPDPIEAVTGADALVVLTEWPEFADIDLAVVAGVMASLNVVDARNMLDREALSTHGFNFVGVGK